ncbi:MAG: Ni/Fe-hydrogenase cytochrome b subunit [Gemmatimonadetes bacterium]|nr:Ni/Fe-hydrogenase cytochrome b subunit [Gemmatimonadota bacterium]
MSNRLRALKTVLWGLVGVLVSVSVVRFVHGLGAVTNLSDAAPWGLWIGFDVMSGVALAAGGFVLAATVYIFGLERYRPFVRAAILTALLGYVLVAAGLLYDLGLPWRIWHPIVNWQYHSVLFEVAACVIIYLNVLILEFLPVVLEHRFFHGAFFQGVLKFLKKVTIPLVIAGIVLSTLHQSSLGSLFLITPFRLHPLWYSPLIYVQFFISAVALGLMTVVLESLFSNYFLGHKLHKREISGLGLAASVVLWVYVALRVGDLFVRGVLPSALDGSWQSGLFAAELAFSAVIPAALMLVKPIRRSIVGVGVAGSMVVLGMVWHRLDVSIVAFARPEGMAYFPSWEEFAVSFGLVAGGILIFLFFVENLNVFDDVKGHPPEEHLAFQAEATVSFLPGPLGIPRRYSVAALSGGILALLFLPVGGVKPTPVPVQGPRSVAAFISPASEGGTRDLALVGSGGLQPTRVLMLDANRDGDVVLFDHDDHAARLGGERSCETCHHLTKPLDENTSCFECHTDMYEPRPVFDHEVHSVQLGGAEGCVQCHGDGSKVKSYETVTECTECHQNEIASRAFINRPEDRWGNAVGYMDAMHSLCIECHEREALTAPARAPENLNQCMTCHDVDWREDVRRLMPHLSRLDRVVSGSVPAAAQPGAGG